MLAKGAGIPSSSQNPFCPVRGQLTLLGSIPFGVNILIPGTPFPAFCEAAPQFVYMESSFSFPKFSHYLKKKKKVFIISDCVWVYAGVCHDLRVE